MEFAGAKIELQNSVNSKPKFAKVAAENCLLLGSFKRKPRPMQKGKNAIVELGVHASRQNQQQKVPIDPRTLLAHRSSCVGRRRNKPSKPQTPTRQRYPTVAVVVVIVVWWLCRGGGVVAQHRGIWRSVRRGAGIKMPVSSLHGTGCCIRW